MSFPEKQARLAWVASREGRERERREGREGEEKGSAEEKEPAIVERV